MAEKDKTSKRKKIVLILISIIILISLGIFFYFGYPREHGVSGFIDGEIYIFFNETINRSRAEKIINEYNLEIISYPSSYSNTYRIKVPNGKEDYYIDLLKKYSEIKDVQRIKEPP